MGPQPDLQEDFDIFIQFAQMLKDKSFTELERDKGRIQEIERDLAACKAEISQLKSPFTISDNEVSGKLLRIYDALTQWVNGFPKFCRFAQNWQAIGQFMQDGSYSDDTYPWVGLDEAHLRRSQAILLSYSIFLILYKWVFQPVLVGADTEMQALLTQLLEGFTALDPTQVRRVFQPSFDIFSMALANNL